MKVTCDGKEYEVVDKTQMLSSKPFMVIEDGVHLEYFPKKGDIVLVLRPASEERSDG